MKKIMSEYVEKKQKITKMEMSVAFVTLIPSLIEKSGVLVFKGGHASYSAKILADENTMFCIADLMPCCDGGGYYFKYFSAMIFLTSLSYYNISFPGSSQDSETPVKTEPPPEPKAEQKTEK